MLTNKVTALFAAACMGFIPVNKAHANFEKASPVSQDSDMPSAVAETGWRPPYGKGGIAFFEPRPGLPWYDATPAIMYDGNGKIIEGSEPEANKAIVFSLIITAVICWLVVRPTRSSTRQPHSNGPVC